MVYVPQGKGVRLTSLARVVHLIAYRVWFGLLTARLAVLIAGLALLAVDMAISRAHAQVAKIEIDTILHDMTPKEVALRRSDCATGGAVALLASDREAGVDSPPPGAWCVAVLTRSGRDGTLSYVRIPGEQNPRPSIAFDTGFVSGYVKHEALPSNAPTMVTLLPIADRCLAQNEPNTNLCTAVGQVLGTRAARGEAIPLR